MNSQKIMKSLIVGMVVLIVSVVIGFFALRTLPIGEKHRPITEYGGNFTLQNHTGDVQLYDFKGKIVIVYFGFLSCTEACPVSMSTLTAAMKELSKDELSQVQGLFVSVDPKRDTYANLKAFSKYYKNRIIGITSNEKNIDKVTKQYGVFFEMSDFENSGLGYSVDHSSRFYLINRKGKLVTAMSHTTKPVELAAEIKQLLYKN